MIKKINLIFQKSNELFEIQQQENENPRYYECPRCNTIITLEDIDIKITEFDCPICEQKNIFPLPEEQSEKKDKEQPYINWLLQLNTKVVIIGLFLIFTSVVLLFQPNPFTIKLGITLLTTGIILPMFLIEKNTPSIKVTLGSIMLIIILFLISGTDLELFFILIFLGLFIMKVIIDNYIPPVLKVRMNIVISAFFIIFVILIIKRIINIVSI
jgi:hypothetical protein